MKTIKLIAIFFLLVLTASAQKSGVKGVIKDATTGEPVIGANVVLSNGKGGVTDTAGRFYIAADSGSYTAKISLLGFITQTIKVTAGVKARSVNISLEGQTLSQVEVIADVARTRETPIAFSTIDAQRLEEELASRDIPMLLTSTPGVYATNGGGGMGDGRVTIRGFDQTNVGVLIDGIPTNDMENGSVYWSDWAGLGDITRSVQVQRGLGASKLAVASIGGTINIMTKGIDAKPSISFAQEFGSDMLLKETLCATTGRMKGDWGITVAGSRKTGDGWVDQTPYQSWSYFVKAEKRIKNHTIAFSTNSAPQSHSQRSYNQNIGAFDLAYAEKLGISPSDKNYIKTNAISNYGIGYNQLWGPLDRWQGNVSKFGVVAPTDTFSHNKSDVNTKVNFFNKPVYNLNEYWNISEKLYLSTALYASTGSGGGTSLYVNPSISYLSNGQVDPTSGYLPNGQMNIQSIYNANKTSFFNITTLAPGHRASNFLYASMNDHKWYGGLSTLTYKLNKAVTLTIGPDLRWYKGSHYYQVYDLLGGDYTTDNSNQNINYLKNPELQVIHVGDKFGKYFDDYVKYGGAFVQAEYVKDKISSFVTGTYVQTSYQRINNYDSSRAHISPLMEYYGYTAKAGANYNLNDHHNVFLNAGYIVKAPPFSNVFDYGTVPAVGADNQKIASIEAGYGFKSRYIAANINAYYTNWQNRPLTYPLAVPDPKNPGQTIYANLNGMDALHRGVELDFNAKPTSKITIGGIMMLANWTWNSGGYAQVYDQLGNPLETIHYNAKGVHVANAPQTQYGLNVRYEPVKHFYVKVQWTYFARIYAQFTPDQLNVDPTVNPFYAAHPGIDAWRLPDYQLVDLHIGYQVKFMNHIKLDLAAHVINLFNNEYIADATNGNSFDASSALVYFGQPRSFLLSMKITGF